MSDEIIDVTSEHVENIPEETITDEGLNIPDSSFIEEIDEEGLQEIQRRRAEVASLPEFPKEWQQTYDDDEDEDYKQFKDKIQVPLTATLKQEEINKLVKKYKRYIKSNLYEIRRLENEN